MTNNLRRYSGNATVWTIALMLLLATTTVCAQQRYRDVVFDGNTVTKDILYRTAPDFEGTPTDLFVDVYEPLTDTSRNRALVLMVHGGGFTGGNRAGRLITQWADSLTRRGFVVASISYRLGVTSKQDPVQMWEASLRACQDVRAAIRYLRSARTTFGIDTSHIFLLGTSAGGLAILQASVLNDSEIPDFVSPYLGGIDGPNVTPSESALVHGLVVCWGAITDTTFIAKGDPPLYAIHGSADATVPVGCAPSSFGFDLCGATPLVERSQNVGNESASLIFEGAGHGLSGEQTLIDSAFWFYSEKLANLIPVAPVSVDDESAFRRSIWPTPATAGEIVNIAIDKIETNSLSLVSLTGGRLVLEPVSISSGTVSFILPPVSSGVYIVEVRTSTTLKCWPIIIQK